MQCGINILALMAHSDPDFDRVAIEIHVQPLTHD